MKAQAEEYTPSKRALDCAKTAQIEGKPLPRPIAEHEREDGTLVVVFEDGRKMFFASDVKSKKEK